MPDLQDLADADASLWNTLRHLTRYAHGGRILEDDGLLMIAGACDVQNPYVNGVIRTNPGVSPVVMVERARSFFDPISRPFVLWAASHRDRDIEQMALDGTYFSYRVEGSPGMTLGHDPGAPQPAADIEVAVVNDEDGHADFIAVTAESYARVMSRGTTEALFANIGILAGKNARAFVIREAGIPVAAAMVTVYDGLGEIGFVGTVPGSRGSGLGGVVTQACAHDAFARGARRVFLQASAMGEPVYRKLGFVELTRYVKFDVPG